MESKINHENHGMHEKGEKSGSVGTPRPALVMGSGFGELMLAIPGNEQKDASRDAPAALGCLLWVGMSVPAHPQANEGLVGYGKRGWLKPPPPEEGR